MLNQLLLLMQKQDFDRAKWENSWQVLTFWDSKDNDPFGITEFAIGTDTRTLWEAIVLMLIEQKIQSFELKIGKYI